MPAAMATVLSQNKYIVAPSMESPALRAFMVVVISAASVNKVDLPWFQHNVQQGHELVPNE